MSKQSKPNTRYSDADLLEFKELVEQKLSQVQKEVSQMEEQSKELNENLNTNSSDLGETGAYADVEFLNRMIIRQKKYIRDLENALLRIQNKNYGICVISGELIDKKRLQAVPITTKSLQRKLDDQKTPKRSSSTSKSSKPQRRKVTSKIIKKNNKPSEKTETPINLNEDGEINSPDIAIYDAFDEKSIKEFKEMAQFDLDNEEE